MSKRKQLDNIIELVEKSCARLRVGYDEHTDYSQIKSFILLDILNDLGSVSSGLADLKTPLTKLEIIDEGNSTTDEDWISETASQ